MAIRRMNYTKRIDLKKSCVRVTLRPHQNSVVNVFDLEMDLPSDLPGDARVILEAYRSNPPVRMRFDLGTVENKKILTEPERLLSDFSDEMPAPLFRLKVIDAGESDGRILADARQIRPVTALEDSSNKQGLLHVYHKPLDGLVWELQIDYPGYGPTLWIDSEIPEPIEFARDPRFIALVYPEVLRLILRHLIIDEPETREDLDWGPKWLEFASKFPEMTGDPPPILGDTGDREECEEWISRSVRSFASMHGLKRPFEPVEEDSIEV